jgi:hypothetical protein
VNRDTILLVEDDPDEAELALFGFGQVGRHYDIQRSETGKKPWSFSSPRAAMRTAPPSGPPAW